MTTARFEDVVDEYDDARPDYPAALYEAVGTAMGGWSGRRVIDVGAGTGIATRQMLELGADVTAVELGSQMLRRLVERSPSATAVQGRGETLPLRDATADLVCAAQAWHWVDPVRGAQSAARVLRSGGVFAAWWNNDRLPENPWCEAQDARLDLHNSTWREGRRPDGPSWLEALRTYGFAVDDQPQVFSWKRSIEIDRYVRWLASKSYVAQARDRDGFLSAEREHLLGYFPDGVVVEHFVTGLWVARLTS